MILFGLQLFDQAIFVIGKCYLLVRGYYLLKMVLTVISIEVSVLIRLASLIDQ